MGKFKPDLGPSPGELRLRGELDKLKRELAKLKRGSTDEQRPGASGAHERDHGRGAAPAAAAPDDVTPAEVVEAPTMMALPAPISAAAAAAATADNEATRLREQI